jgi:hypothetical protein
VTTDSDFAALSGERGWPPKVIHLEECDYPLRIIEELLRQNAVRISEFVKDSDTAYWRYAWLRIGASSKAHHSEVEGVTSTVAGKKSELTTRKDGLSDGRESEHLVSGICKDRLTKGRYVALFRRCVVGCLMLGKSPLPTAGDFETEIRDRWAVSQKQGATHLDIKAGELHHKLGGYPASDGGHRMPDCCQVMKRLMQAGDTVRHSPPKGAGASLVVRYTLPRI